MSRAFVLNTLAYKQVFNENPTLGQAELLHEIKTAGFQIIEIRREYIKGGEEEIRHIAKKAVEEEVNLLYSIPDELYKKNELNPALEQYFKEAQLLHSPQIKLTLGEYENITEQQAEIINEYMQKYAIKVLIENDQNKEISNSLNLKTFVTQAEQIGLAIGLTFDIGNFVHIGENPMESAQTLKPFVQYIHIKNTKKTKTGIVTTDIESGDLNIEAIINEFPKDLPYGLEYSCGERSRIVEKMAHERELIHQMSLL